MNIEPQNYKILQREKIDNNYSICDLTNNAIIIGSYKNWYIYKKEDGIKYYLVKSHRHNYYSRDIKQISNNEFVIKNSNILTFVNFENKIIQPKI